MGRLMVTVNFTDNRKFLRFVERAREALYERLCISYRELLETSYAGSAHRLLDVNLAALPESRMMIFCKDEDKLAFVFH